MDAVSRVTLTIDGEEEDNFTEITEPEVEYNKSVDLMHKTVNIPVTRRYKGIKVKYIVPIDEPERNWSAIKDGTLTITYENGQRRVYSGVTCNKVGGETYKDGTETVRDVELSAVSRYPE
jgi:hypothetical protein